MSDTEKVLQKLLDEADSIVKQLTRDASIGAMLVRSSIAYQLMTEQFNNGTIIKK